MSSDSESVSTTSTTEEFPKFDSWIEQTHQANLAAAEHPGLRILLEQDHLQLLAATKQRRKERRIRRYKRWIRFYNRKKGPKPSPVKVPPKAEKKHPTVQQLKGTIHLGYLLSCPEDCDKSLLRPSITVPTDKDSDSFISNVTPEYPAFSDSDSSVDLAELYYFDTTLDAPVNTADFAGLLN